MTRSGQRLGDFFTSRRERGEDGLPTLSVTLDRGLVPRESLERKTETNLTPHEHLRVRPGDIAYNMMRMWQGASGLSDQDAIVSPAYIVLAPKPNIDPVYASYLFKSSEMIHRFWAYSYGLTNDRLRLYFNDFKRVPASIPPLPEQRKIAEILSTWDRAIDTTEALLVNARTQKRALMRSLLTGHRRFPEFKGQEWREVRLGEVFDVQLGKMLNRTAREGPEQYPYLTNFNVRWGSFDLTDLNRMHFDARDREKFRLKYGDLIVCEGGEVGRCAVWRNGPADCYFQKALHRVRSRSGAGSTEFLRFQLEHLANTGRLQHFTGKSSIPHLTRERFQSIPIQLPSPEEQQRITCVLLGIEGQEAPLKEMVHRLHEERGALMQQLLTGKRRVAVA